MACKLIYSFVDLVIDSKLTVCLKSYNFLRLMSLRVEANLGLLFRYNRNWLQILIVTVDTKKQHKKIKFICVVVMNIGQCLDIFGSF